MKEWIIVAANKAGFELKEGGPIKQAVPWPGNPAPTPSAGAGKVSSEVAANVAWLTENAKYSSEELAKLMSKT